ncbi:MAG: Uma2 family endonuclease [Gloeocapsa sp. UFS-A4-WI-NPMV-4B04]|jgi:Uma2 family endonuclease|nr:Uma2 family endonuclease [Gloeocapsa sp. UFS-A4-WI-NPMV-4B04]
MPKLINSTEIENSPLVLYLHPVVQLTNDQFFEFCQLNQNLRFERTARGELLIMPPTGTGAGGRNFRLIGQLFIWTEQNKTGIGFDSSTGFILPNGATVSPDAAWIKLERWNALSTEQQEKFAAISPDFVVELRFSSDNLIVLKAKMQEYIDNGAKLGWLIDRKHRKVYIYRPQMSVECLDNPVTVSGDPELPGFVFDLSKIW